ncbi:MAG: prolyl oligopeptidase family serine peptidase [Myxococcaceae bacterium]|nr:prolyl oligopeptidase family serine peptidase [Myxococcaceae bacterium]
MKRFRLPIALTVVALSGAFCWTCAHRPSSAPGHAQGRLESGGRVRTYISWSPDGPGPFPLVLALHGRLGTGAQMLTLTSLTALAEQERFIVVYPDGIGRSWADGRGTSPASKEGVDDVAFLSALIDELVKNGRADARRVYVTGMSNGGFMALTLACLVPEKLAAVGTVTGFMGEDFATRCVPARPTPVAIVAGDTDPIVPFVGGELQGGRGRAIGAEATFARWLQLDGCPGTPVVTALPDAAPDDGTTIERREVSGCSGGSAVRLDVVKGGGHTWPRGDRYLPARLVGRVSQDMDASAELWRFFKPFSR